MTDIIIIIIIIIKLHLVSHKRPSWKLSDMSCGSETRQLLFRNSPASLLSARFTFLGR